MSNFKVLRKSDGEEVLRYSADTAQTIKGFDLVDYDHVEYSPDTTEPTVLRMTWTQTQWKRRFTQLERLAIRDAATHNPELADYMDLMNGSDEIANDDPDTINAVNLLEAVGLIGAGRANEVLYAQ